MEVFTERNGRRMLKVSKVKGPVRCYNQKTPVPGIPKTCTIEKVDKGTHAEYYACLSCWDDVERRRGEEYLSEHSPDAVGIDMGVSKTATLSDGTVYGNGHMYSKLLDLFRKRHEAFSTMLPGTPGYRKARSRLSHLYGRLRGIRRNNVETISRQIVDAFDIICMEDLKVGKIRSKSRGKRMTNAYDDASLGMLRRRLIDKAIEAGRKIILVDPKWTSQVCCRCGACVRKGLEVRTHVCPECGLVMDRDLNSAINILIWGLTGNPFPERWDE
jgi:putative transposase